MSAVDVSRYLLRSATPLNRLTGRREFQGALLRIGSGYTCLHPWPELGDLPLEDQLKVLSGGDGTTALIERARECARIDGEARESGVSLFAGLEIPESHWLWNSGMNRDEQLGSVVRLGIRAVKMKCDGSGEDAAKLAEIAEEMPGGVLLRPDLNGALDPESVPTWFRRLSGDVRRRIDFIEDPLAYDPVVWRELADELGCDFALDRVGKPDLVPEGGFRWRIVKPAADDPDAVARETEDAGLVFTSYLDHPIGQVFAAYAAARMAVEGRCEIGLAGLISHPSFERNPFSEALGIGEGGKLIVPGGAGLGFGELLESLPWEEL